MEVFKQHRKIGVVYFEHKKLKSVLFSLDKRRRRKSYRDGDTIYLCFDENSKKYSEVKHIISWLKIGDVFTVYEKVSSDFWTNAGMHVCVDIGEGLDAENRQSFIVKVKSV
mgnify:CR=1 FL=1